MVVGVLAPCPAVAGGEEDVGAEAAAALADGVLDRRPHGGEGRGVEVVVEIAAISPTVVGDVDVDLTFQVGDFLGKTSIPAETHAEARDRRVIGDADGAKAVVAGGDEPGYRGAVGVRSFRHGVVVAAARVVIERGVVIGGQVGVVVIDAIVVDADDDALPRIVVPDLRDVDVDARRATGLAGVEQVPLVVEKAVGGNDQATRNRLPGSRGRRRSACLGSADDSLAVRGGRVRKAELDRPRTQVLGMPG